MKVIKFWLVMAAITIASIAHAQQMVNYWLTTADRSSLLSEQDPLRFSDEAITDTGRTIKVNSQIKYQSIDGFGFALTGGSAQHILKMSKYKRRDLIHELFSTTNTSIGISYLRLSIGSSDLNDHTFSYDDMPAGTSDPQLQHFTLKEDEKDVVPVLHQILAVNPKIKILASPWSAPVWMKTNGNIQGGSLKPEDYAVYARYFVKYIKGMQRHGITIDAITVQNEPFNDGNTPSMQFLAKQELDFIKNYLGPAFKANGITTKIILYDHNCDAPEYPVSILTDPGARKYIAGSAFHLYAGKITALSKVHNAFPEKALYFTEMMAVSHDDFNVASPEERIVIGATRNWSRNVLLWNLAADRYYRPHTDNGGCAFCQGAITIDGDTVSRNLAYYTIAHASKFVPANSYRIDSTLPGGLSNVSFITPDGKIVLIVANNGRYNQNFNVAYNGKIFKASLNSASVATYVW